jgi:hypothetical protein
MSDSVQTRRDPWSRRVFCLNQVRREPPRPRSGWLAHLSFLDTVHTFPGLEPVLATSQLAAHLGVPVQTIHDLRHAHRGPRGFRVGRARRYLSEVQHWFEVMESEDHAADFAQGAQR